MQEMVEAHFFDNLKFFRVVPGFMVQFGIHALPEQGKIWREKIIQDDPTTQSNTRGMVSFATSGKNTRTTQMFINFWRPSFSICSFLGFPTFGHLLANKTFKHVPGIFLSCFDHLVSPKIKRNGFGARGHVRKSQKHRSQGFWVLP